MTDSVPKVFFSYSHDNQSHKDWILYLATRLMSNGVDVILDQWDLALGEDLPRFMESSLRDADRVLAICTSQYVEKANASNSGGVAFEKMILTGQMMRNITAERIIPVLRDNDSECRPTFLESKVFIDFRDDALYQSKYAELIREIHGEKIKPRPPLGDNPFKKKGGIPQLKLSDRPERYVSPALSGQVTFDYSNNNGRFVIGAGDMAFRTMWSSASNRSIHAYSDPSDIRSVALAIGFESIEAIQDASIYDASSRVRTPHLGEIVVWQNTSGYFAATRIENLKSRSHGDSTDEVTFSYSIQPDRSPSFSSVKTNTPD